MSYRHEVDRWLMVLTTKEASYIIVLGIVISVLPITSTFFSWFHSVFTLFWTPHWCCKDVSIVMRIVDYMIQCCLLNALNSVTSFVSVAFSVLLTLPCTCFCSKSISISKLQLLIGAIWVQREVYINLRWSYQYGDANIDLPIHLSDTYTWSRVNGTPLHKPNT